MTTLAHDLARSRRFLVVEDVDLIMEAVRTLPTDRHVTVIDLGAGSGTTALSVFCARSEHIRVITVDHDPVAIGSTGQCMKNAGFRDAWLSILGDSVESLNFLRDILIDPVDMLLVDANHEYEAVKADLAAWLPLVRDGAPVWMHDTTDEYPGCRRAVEEAIADGRLIRVKAAGWGWLGRKAAQS